jgi:hypothetical protein
MTLLDRIARSRGNRERTIMALHLLRLKNSDKKPKFGEHLTYLSISRNLVDLTSGSNWVLRRHLLRPLLAD